MPFWLQCVLRPQDTICPWGIGKLRGNFVVAWIVGLTGLWGRWARKAGMVFEEIRTLCVHGFIGWCSGTMFLVFYEQCKLCLEKWDDSWGSVTCWNVVSTSGQQGNSIQEATWNGKQTPTCICTHWSWRWINNSVRGGIHEATFVADG